MKLRTPDCRLQKLHEGPGLQPEGGHALLLRRAPTRSASSTATPHGYDRRRLDTNGDAFARRQRLLDRNDQDPRRSPQSALGISDRYGSRDARPEVPWTPHNPDMYVEIELAGTKRWFSSLLLRDMCDCSRCVDSSSKQKLFSTVDIPHNIQASRTSTTEQEGIRLRWTNDVAGYDGEHESTFGADLLRRLANVPGSIPAVAPLPKPVHWSAAQQTTDVPDVAYEAYMSDDSTLHQALLTLHTHGLLFLTSVPENEASVSSIVERIGPLKNTFYGSTWDVRSVPNAKNVAYTARDLGFHMDLLYMQQPPRLQFLHCIRSSSEGGASLFTDSMRAAKDLIHQDHKAFFGLVQSRIGFHYNHPDEYYHYAHPTISVQLAGGLRLAAAAMEGPESDNRFPDSSLEVKQHVIDSLRSVAWAPPFQSPFHGTAAFGLKPDLRVMNQSLQRWRWAAQKLNALIHKPDGILERMMKPGECVIFDNQRILHARRAFEVQDAGKERWLRGAYLDSDPYYSKLRVLGRKLGSSLPVSPA
ncbi:hypothetical protein LTR12_010809 [Friedmanniomyces endolithicus]|nr:hypothetical protein LTR12_010809 [Friedmanniomyces endolithicus]